MTKSDVNKQIEATREEITGDEDDGEDVAEPKSAITRQIEATREEITGDEGQEPAPGQDWYINLKTDNNGSVKANLANAIIAFKSDPAWQGVLGFDLFQNDLMLLSTPPSFGRTPEPVTEPRKLRDSDIINAQAWLQVAGIPNVGKEAVHDALTHVAMANSYHPVREYLRTVEWDQINRLDYLLSSYFGAADDEYTRAISRMWMIQAVRRVFEPGCQADYAIILESRQGTGKSTGLRALAGDWFGDNIPPDLGSKDAKQYLSGLWIVELTELASLNKTDIEQVKSFITTPVDQYRPPYGKRREDVPRQCVFAGTTNQGEYLNDSTGSRRFWPVACGAVDVASIQRDRDQLWAEAVAAYQSAEEPWPSPELEQRVLRPAQDERYAEDAWAPAIRDTLDMKRRSMEKPSATVAQVAGEALDLTPARVGQRERARIVRIMREQGWQSRKGGKGTRYYEPVP